MKLGKSWTRLLKSGQSNEKESMGNKKKGVPRLSEKQTKPTRKVRGIVRIYVNPSQSYKRLPIKVKWQDGRWGADFFVDFLKPLPRDVVSKRGNSYWIEERREDRGIAYIDQEGKATLIYGWVPYSVAIDAANIPRFRNAFCIVRFPIQQSSSIKNFKIQPERIIDYSSILNREIEMTTFHHKLPHGSPVAAQDEDEGYEAAFSNAVKPGKIIDVTALTSIDDLPDEAERYDLRDRTAYTIDSETTKDIDDAIEVIIIARNRYIIGIHIADVTEFVAEGTPRDEDAKSRGTSHYLANQVIHMLPSILSENYCSLNENRDRLAVSVYVEIEFSEGNYEVKGLRFAKSVIRSNAKLSYKLVEDIINGTFAGAIDRDVFASLLDAYHVSQKIVNSSRNRGNAYDSPNVKYYEDENGNIGRKEEIIGKSNKLIETFMVTANQMVGERMADAIVSCSANPGGIGLYRVQKSPSEKDLREYLSKLTEADIVEKSLRYDDLKSGVEQALANDSDQQNRLSDLEKNEYIEAAIYQKICSAMDRNDEKTKIKLGVLGRYGYKAGRIQAKAGLSDRYDASFHQSLGINRYAWFTSPIRRYTDIVNHRQIKAILSKEPPTPSGVNVQLLMEKIKNADFAEGHLNRRLQMYHLHERLRQQMQLEVQIASFEWVNPDTFRLVAIWEEKYFLEFLFQKKPYANIEEQGLSCLLDGKTYRIADHIIISIDDPAAISPEKGYIMVQDGKRIIKINKTYRKQVDG